LVEHLPLKEVVPSSSLGRLTRLFFAIITPYVMGIGIYFCNTLVFFLRIV